MTTTPRKTAAPKTPKTTAADETIWDRLAAPFDATWVEKLPKQVTRGDTDRGRCVSGSRVSADGHFCGGYHARSVHLDYIGHAGITMRLNSVVGPSNWSLEPLATTPEGLPAMSRGEFWARLKITDPVTGDVAEHVDVAANFNSTQEAWGDALRRCAMRFGVGTYLWAKSEYAAELAAHRDPDPVEIASEAGRLIEWLITQTAPLPLAKVEDLRARVGADVLNHQVNVRGEMVTAAMLLERAGQAPAPIVEAQVVAPDPEPHPVATPPAAAPVEAEVEEVSEALEVQVAGDAVAAREAAAVELREMLTTARDDAGLHAAWRHANANGLLTMTLLDDELGEVQVGQLILRRKALVTSSA